MKVKRINLMAFSAFSLLLSNGIFAMQKKRQKSAPCVFEMNNTKNKKLIAYAKYCNNSAAVEQLIADGANVNAQDCNGRTALIWATIKGNEGIMKLLFANGADSLIKDNDGQNALENSIEYGTSDCFWNAICASDKNPKHVLSLAVDWGRVDVVKKILALGDADVNDQCTCGGRTPLMLAAQTAWEYPGEYKKQLLEMVQMLLDHGADVSLKGDDGRSALDIARDLKGESARPLVRLLEDHENKKQQEVCKKRTFSQRK